ncbi:hypothetical protein H8D85_01755 [bacterium]|nr:hypothetical protein [bacterium]
MAKKTVFDFNEFTARFELQTFELLPTVISGEPLTTVLTYPTTDFPDNSTLNQITTTSGYLQTAVHDGQSVDISVETDIVMDSVFIQYDPS